MSLPHHTEDLGTLPIGRLLLRFAVPSSIAFFVSSTYNLVDAVFVGRGVGPLAIGALTLVMPFQMFMMAFGALIAIGSASITSRAFGAGLQKRARSAAGTAIAMAGILGIVITISGRIFLDPLLRVLGASGDLVGPTKDYFGIILFVEPLLLLNLTGESLIRTEGRAKVAMLTMVSGMLVNILLDPIFIFIFGWGVRGAAAATLIGRSVTLLLIVRYQLSGKSSFQLKPRDFLPKLRLLIEIASIGLSGFVRQVSESIVYAVGNNLLMAFGGGMYVTAYGAVFRAVVFLGMPALGVAQALPPIAGYNYGAGKYERVRRAVWLSILASTAMMVIGFTIAELVPGTLLRFFSSDPQLIADGITIMRVKAPVFLVYPAYMIGSALYQAIGKTGRALALSLTRPLFSVIVMFFFVGIFGAITIVAAEPIAVACGASITLGLLKRDMKKLRQGPI